MKKFYTMTLAAAVGISAFAAAPQQVAKSAQRVADLSIATTNIRPTADFVEFKAGVVPSFAAAQTSEEDGIFGNYRFISFNELSRDGVTIGYEMYVLKLSEGEDGKVLVSGILGGYGDAEATYDAETGILSIPSQVIFSDEDSGDVTLHNATYNFDSDELEFNDAEPIQLTYDEETKAFEFPEDFAFCATSGEDPNFGYWMFNTTNRLFAYEPGEPTIPYSKSKFTLNYPEDEVLNDQPVYIYIDEESNLVSVDGICGIGVYSQELKAGIINAQNMEGVYDPETETISLTNGGYFIAETQSGYRLAYAAVATEGATKYDFDNITFSKDENGFWVFDQYEFDVIGVHTTTQQQGGFLRNYDFSLREANGTVTYDWALDETRSGTYTSPIRYGYVIDGESAKLEMTSLRRDLGCPFSFTAYPESKEAYAIEQLAYAEIDEEEEEGVLEFYYASVTDDGSEVSFILSASLSDDLKTVKIPANGGYWTTYSPAGWWSGMHSQATITGEPYMPEGFLGIGSIESDGNANAPVEYYNLQGMKIANPAAGQIIIVKKGTDVSKQIIR